MRRILILVLSIFVILLIVFPFVSDGENQPIDPAVRSKSQGSFIETPDGFVHYKFEGPQNGEIVVLVHGFSMPLFIYEPLSVILQKEGFRVLRFDLFGRGLSDRPNTNYDPDLFEKQISSLFYFLNIKKPINLLGTSMGGIIVSDFTLKHPEKVKKLILISPGGFPMEIPWIGKLTRLSGIGDYLIKSLGDKTLLKGTKDSFYEPENFPNFNSLFQEQMQYKGFKQAILSSLRNMPLESFLEKYKQLGFIQIPKLLIWGKEDKIIPFKNSSLALETLPGIEFLALEKAGHIPHYESPERVAPKLLEFLKK
ncbi:alpha/beta fold hydrolase [Leptospira sp. WS92.C1]